MHGWETQLAHILKTSRNLSFAERIPQAAWRGRADFGRDWLRWGDPCTGWSDDRLHRCSTEPCKKRP